MTLIAPPTTDIEIISQAAMLCGKQGFSTLSAGGAFAKDASQLYGSLVSAELGSNRWRFAQEFQAIATLTTLTPSFEGWLYYWEMPADMLMLFRLDPMVQYEVFGSRILTKSNQSLTAIYAKNVPVSKWPPAFAMHITYALGSMLAMSVTNSDTMVARIESKGMLWESRALFSDGQNTKSKTFKSQPYIDARYRYRSGSRSGNRG